MDVGVRTCPACKQEIERKKLDRLFSVCPNCGYYMRFHAYKRIKMLADEKSFVEWDTEIEFTNPLEDPIYDEKLLEAYKKHGIKDAIITGKLRIEGQPVAVGVMDSRFMMASMGQFVGEKVTRLFERAMKEKLSVLLFCCSGGARMQEGIISLMQMEKTSAAVKRHSEAGLLYISVLINPTMGGVTASYAMQADIILAEQGAMIGFAGPRVIEQNTREKLPEEFQTAEFQLAHGFVDDVITRKDTKRILGQLIRFHEKDIREFEMPTIRRRKSVRAKTDESCNGWEKVKIARMNERPTSLDYINQLFDDFMELHGDRVYRDDHAIVSGIASFQGHTVTVIGQQKGKGSVEEAVFRNYGMASPEGYRKALRICKQAEKFHRPVICLIDTIGAACGKEAEERGQGVAIANSLYEMASIKTPILSIIISEGGSGGALALGVGNEVWMLENAVYSVLTPEGYASIVWKDNNRAEDAAKIMKLKPEDLYDLGVIERIIAESEPVTVSHMDEVCNQLKTGILQFLKKYGKKSGKYLVNHRYNRFRKF